MKVEPVRLEGETLVLVPQEAAHAPALFRLVDEETFALFAEFPAGPGYEAFEDWIRRNLALPNCLEFTMLDRATGEPVGSTAFLDIRPAHLGLEVGRTWIGRSFQGTRVNPESKYLLFRHAFETLGAVRVQLKTDVRNLRSQRAIEKLGAVQEGVLRRYQRRSNGEFRDTMMYSVIAADWPEVKARLEARLQA